MKDFISFFFKGLYLFLTQANFRTFVRLFLFNAWKRRYSDYTVNVNGFKILVADMKSFIWQYQEIFVYNFYEFNPVTQHPVIYDCGSNIGTSILFFSKKYPKAKIIAYEASPHVYGILEKNIKQNKISNVTAYPNAVWIKNELINFNDEGADAGSLYSVSNAKSIQIQAVDFREILKRENKIDLLKMDIEGAENELLPHISTELYKIDKLFIEYHSFNGSEQKLDEILRLLRKSGFRFYIRHVNDRKRPFIDMAKGKDMDMQLNIFAYKV